MSQADYPPDSTASSTAAAPGMVPGNEPATPPPPPSIQQVPPPPPASSVPPVPSGGNPVAGPAPVVPAAAVPPPPPPRSSLPPVRKPADLPAVTSGVGSAKGVRWRGELSGLQPAATPKSSPTPVGSGDIPAQPDTDDETGNDPQLAREAPPWLVSMVFHLVFLLILALITSPAGTGIGRVILTLGESNQESPAELTEFSIATEVSIEESQELQESEVEVEIPDIFESTSVSDLDEVAPVELGVGTEITITKPMFNGRSGAMKNALLAIYGGSPETQDAVARGLAWLKRNQRSNGSWSMRGPFRDGGITENEAAATAMALLAFLGDGNTHKSGKYKDEVEKGMKFLLSKQDRSGFFARNAREHEQMYAQAQASIAVCELYAMTKDSWLRPPAQLALDFAQESQSPQGGWRYQPGRDSDTSVTGWFVMALQSGRAAGLNVDISVLGKVDDYLDTASSFDDAAYAYQPRSAPSAAMTAEGILCRQYISWTRKHPPMFRGIQALLEDSPFDIRDRDVYYWYYATQVMHHFGGSPWRLWNEKMRTQLPKAQVSGGREDGSWAPQQDVWGRNSGRLFTTCLSILLLGSLLPAHATLQSRSREMIGQSVAVTSEPFS